MRAFLRSAWKKLVSPWPGSAASVMETASGTPASAPRSTSPVKPEDEATEPKEEAKCVMVPSPSTSDADTIDSCIGESGANGGALGTTALVTKQMIEEEEKMAELGELEEKRRKEEQEKLWETMDENDKEQRFQRLQYLLQRSNMYTEYLLERMKRQEVEEAKRKERRVRKLAKQEEKKKEEEKKDKEQPQNGQESGTEPVEDENARSLRGHKRRAAEEPVLKKETAAETHKAPTSKRRRVGKQNALSQDNTEASEEKAMENTTPTPIPTPATDKSPDDSPTISEQDDNPRSFNGEDIPDAQPLLMTGGVLRPYQLEGYQWLKTLYENGVNGILADEMGLGKTVQCVAMLAHMAYMGVPGPFLICAPLSTIPNWYSEFQRFAPRVPVMLYHGSKDERATLRNKMHRLHTVREGVKIFPCVVTSYEVAMMDKRFLQQHDWRYLIVDEGHRIKNTHCRLIGALRMYKTTNRLLLTGTPLQNNLAELWSLLNFLLPEIFDDLGSFEAWFDIEHIGDGSVCRQIAADEQRKSVLSMLHQILTPFMLRRLKTDVDLRIPPKKEVIVYAPLLPLQKEFYAALIDRTIFAKIQEKNEGTKVEVEVGANGRPVRKAATVKVDYSLMIGDVRDDKECSTPRQKKHEEEELDGWVKAIVDMQQKRAMKKTPEQRVSQLTIKLRNVMMQLRKCCSHPFLLEHPLDPKTGDLAVDERIISHSGKILVLDRMLAELRKRGHKVLIFSQMTKMLDLLEDFCVLRKYEYCRLDGAMNIMDRKENMEEYQKVGSDKFVFLLSTRAGGLGINLTAADTVIIYDSDWNPQCDLQAQDRCHRIGQTRPVMVYRLVTANTIDQRIVERAAAKRKLEKLVIHQGKFKSGIKDFKTSLDPVSSEELLELLNSRDHESEVGERESQTAISDADLLQLLDRSDLEAKWQAKLNKAAGDADEKSNEKSQPQSPSSPATPNTTSGRKPANRSSKRQTGKGRAGRNSNTNNSACSDPPSSGSSLFKVIDIDDGDLLLADS